MHLRHQPVSQLRKQAYQQKAMHLYFPMICLVQASDMGWCLKMQLFAVFSRM
jgi:hypothetical protein